MEFLVNNSGTVSFIFFFSIFIMVLFSVLRPSIKDKIESYKNMPFMEDLDGEK